MLDFVLKQKYRNIVFYIYRERFTTNMVNVRTTVMKCHAGTKSTKLFEFTMFLVTLCLCHDYTVPNGHLASTSVYNPSHTLSNAECPCVARHILWKVSCGLIRHDQPSETPGPPPGWLQHTRACSWFSSYLGTRSQSVLVSENMSESKILKCGVPQGSVLGSLLFVLYTNPLEKIIENFDVNHHAFADDLQLIDSFKPEDIQTARSRVSQCTKAISSWMMSNELKLNDDKTEAMLIGTSQRLKKINSTDITVATSDIPLSSSVKNLGVYVDLCLSAELATSISTPLVTSVIL